jgi:hypothetical protein
MGNGGEDLFAGHSRGQMTNDEARMTNGNKALVIRILSFVIHFGRRGDGRVDAFTSSAVHRRRWRR